VSFWSHSSYKHSERSCYSLHPNYIHPLCCLRCLSPIETKAIAHRLLDCPLTVICSYPVNISCFKSADLLSSIYRWDGNVIFETSMRYYKHCNI